MGISKGRASVVTTLLVGFVIGAVTTAMAVHPDPTYGSGTKINQVKTAKGGSHLHPFVVTSDIVALPGAEHTLRLTRTSLVIGRLTASASCTGDSRCDVGIFAGDGTTDFELVSASFDSGSGSDGVESHAMDGSATLPPGDYTVEVMLEGDPGTTFSVEDWHFTVEVVV